MKSKSSVREDFLTWKFSESWKNCCWNWKFAVNGRLICLVVWVRLFLVKLSEQVGGPIDQIEQRKHERKKDARQNVDSFAATRKFVEPRG